MMIRFFRIQEQDDSGSPSFKFWVFAVLIIVIVVSFFLQMALGLCPVP